MRRASRGSGRLAAAAALLAILLALVAPAILGDAAWAQRDRRETERYLRHALGEICGGEVRPRDDGGCDVRIDETGLWMEREYRRNRGSSTFRSDDARILIETTIAYDDRSHFFCGPEEADGRAPLFVACRFEDATRGPTCVTETRTVLETGAAPRISSVSTPIAAIARARPRRCAELGRAFNSLLPGPRAGADPYVRDPG